MLGYVTFAFLQGFALDNMDPNSFFLRPYNGSFSTVLTALMWNVNGLLREEGKGQSKNLLGFLCFFEVEFAQNHYKNGLISKCLNWL